MLAKTGIYDEYITGKIMPPVLLPIFTLMRQVYDLALPIKFA
jgi:hypothetical protein